jgi:hypothetical protein
MSATKPAPPLADVLAGLVASQHPKKLKPLSGGLILAYTPGPCNKAEPGIYRLTLTRRGDWPSDNEIEVVRRDLRQALKSLGRAAETINIEPYHKGPATRRPSDRVHYHVLFWRELVQASLL